MYRITFGTKKKKNQTKNFLNGVFAVKLALKFLFFFCLIFNWWQFAGGVLICAVLFYSIATERNATLFRKKKKLKKIKQVTLVQIEPVEKQFIEFVSFFLVLCIDKWKQSFFFEWKSNDCLCNRRTNEEHHDKIAHPCVFVQCVELWMQLFSIFVI